MTGCEPQQSAPSVAIILSMTQAVRSAGYTHGDAGTNLSRGPEVMQVNVLDENLKLV